MHPENSCSKRLPLLGTLCGVVFACLSVRVAADDAVFAPLAAPVVRAKIAAWAEQQGLPDALQQQILQTWDAAGTPSVDASAVLERAIICFGVGDPSLAPFLKDCQAGSPAKLALLSEMLRRPELDPFVATNLHAYLGRVYAEQRMYDEALAELGDLNLTLAIDPPAALFYRAVSAHEILDAPRALLDLQTLQQQTEQVPQRYSTISELLRLEIEESKPQSLREVAHLMHDSERRLDLGRAGERVQDVQERIVSTLDELIKKLEAQQGGGGGGGAGANNSNESSSPADDSRVKGSTAPGETDDKKFSKEGNWGDLPEKQQVEAKNLINREFPSHYRQAIETYFKKLAGRPAPSDK